MERMKRLYAAGAIAVTVVMGAGCTHNPPPKIAVMPTEGSTVRVVVNDDKRDEALDAARQASKDYCAKRGRVVKVESEAVAYRGTLNEGARNAMQRVGNVPLLPSFGMDVARSASRDADYRADLVFTCE